MKNIEIPKVGLGFPRELLPQLGSHEDILKNFEDHGVVYKEIKIDSKELHPTQSEFNADKVRGMMGNPLATVKPVVVSNDNYIVDGHHRWLVQYNRGNHTKCLKVDMPILELLKLVKSFSNTQYKNVDDKKIAESVLALSRNLNR